MKQQVLVTGGTGFTGSHLCKRLLKENYRVRALVRSPESADDLRAMGAEVAVGDLRDQDSLEKATTNVDTVYHIAAMFRQENISRQDMWAINAEGTQKLLDASIKNGVKRFVHCSTVGVHGEIKNPPADENAPYGPGDFYQESKTDGERIAIDYMAQNKLPITVFRPGGIYGPGDLRFLKLFKTIKNGRFIMFGSGNVLYQLIYIDDLVQGILLCGTDEKAIGHIYILTGKEPLPLNKLVEEIANVVEAKLPKLRLPVMPLYWAGYACELICKPFGIEPPIYRRRVDFFRKDRAFTIAKAEKDLGFHPTVDLRSGLMQTAAWYKKKGYL